MGNLDEVDTNLRRLPVSIDQMGYTEIYDILFSVPNSEIPIVAHSLLGALSLTLSQIGGHQRLDHQEKEIIRGRIATLVGANK